MAKRRKRLVCRRGLGAPDGCHELATKASKALSNAMSASDRPNLTHSQATALHKKWMARHDKLEAQFKKLGC
jgi:hypothetical protein